MSMSAKSVSDRITGYLTSGGLFNPELANHDAVRDLLLDARAQLDLLASVEDGEGIVRELRDCENACRINGLNVTADIYGNAAARIMLDAQEKAALQGKIARLKEVAHNNAERSNANYVAMQSALEFIDLTIERREAFAEYRAAPPKE